MHLTRIVNIFRPLTLLILTLSLLIATGCLPARRKIVQKQTDANSDTKPTGELTPDSSVGQPDDSTPDLVQGVDTQIQPDLIVNDTGTADSKTPTLDVVDTLKPGDDAVEVDQSQTTDQQPGDEYQPLDSAIDTAGPDLKNQPDPGGNDADSTSVEPDQQSDTSTDSLSDTTADSSQGADMADGNDAGLTPDTSVCSPGTKLCENDTLKTCRNDGSGYQTQPCSHGCQTTAPACRVCAPNSKQCSGKKLQICKTDGSGWSDSICSIGCHQAGDLSQCVVCEPDSKQCKTNALQTCATDGLSWTSEPCSVGCHEDGDQSQCMVCLPNSKKCAGQSLQTCETDGRGWAEQPCGNGCFASGDQSACMACIPSKTRCKDSGTLETCRQDGSGYDQSGCSNGCYANDEKPFCIPESLFSSVKVAKQLGRFTCGIQQTTQNLWCWGQRVWELGMFTNDVAVDPELVGGKQRRWKHVTLGLEHVCAVSVDDTLWCFGANKYGQLGFDSAGKHQVEPKKLGNDKWITVTSGRYFTCGIKTDNTAWCWGDNAKGQLGQGTNGGQLLKPTQVGIDNWIKISANGSQICGLLKNGANPVSGELYCWGDNGGDPQPSPIRRGSDHWVSVSLFEHYGGIGVKADGSLWQWESSINNMEQVGVEKDWLKVFGGNGGYIANRCAIRKSTGNLYCWGERFPGNGERLAGPQPALVGKAGWKWLEVGIGSETYCGLRDDATVWCWGGNHRGMLGNRKFITYKTPQISSTTISNWTTLSTGRSHTCGLAGYLALELYCWGYNYGDYDWKGDVTGQLGTDQSTDQPFPNRIGEPFTYWETVSGVFDHTCAVKTGDASLWCWGVNSQGQLGVGDKQKRTAPTQLVPGDSVGWKSVSTGRSHTCGIKKDDTLWCWGDNSNGQLGDEAITSSDVPVRVGSGFWRSVSAAVYTGYTCGILKSTDQVLDSTLWCWGDNPNGQLGTGDTQPRTVPTQIGTDKWSSVHVGNTNTAGLKLDGTLWYWGDFTYVGSSLIPAKYGDDEWLQVSLGGYLPSLCGIKADHSLWCMGRGAIITGQVTPTEKADWRYVSVGSDSHVCGILSGQLKCWGGNRFGQLALGFPGYEVFPQKVELGLTQ